MSVDVNLGEVVPLDIEHTKIAIQNIISSQELIFMHDGRTVAEACRNRFGDMVLQIDRDVWGLMHETISVHRYWPKTWWDAVKARWTPLWLLRRRWVKVEYERIDIEERKYPAICTHLDIDPQAHLMYLAEAAGLLSKKEGCRDE
jgi:hypothetical protein